MSTDAVCFSLFLDGKLELVEDYYMEAVLKVEGMMCTHCKAAVEKACKAVPGVTAVVVDLKGKSATVTGNADINALKKAIVDEGFEVV